MRPFMHKRQPRRVAVLTTVAVLLLLLSGLYASGTLRASDDERDSTVPPYRNYLPLVRLAPTPTATPIPFPQLVNGLFDQGPNVGWTQSPETLIVPVRSIPAAARGGADSSYVAWLGGEPGADVLSQKVFIPYIYGFQVRLKFFAYTESQASRCTSGSASLYSVESNVPLWTTPLCSREATNAWQEYTVDLSGFGGKQVELRFISQLDSSNTSNWFLNRVRLCQAGAAGC